MGLMPPIIEERKNEFADSFGTGPVLTIDEGEYDYDLTALDTDEHHPHEPEVVVDCSIHRVQHPNRDYIRKWKNKGMPYLADHRR